ncbi:uncharacterized protein LOC128992862 [Macrosteles quadrilineatus]|uniref:uncharacterized protein LOC128992862 n=1 Tax=Macrosteles quadrilineatus TaxID=74068 RepID=UPI0023E18824|nr:uncharacterized protein LOC128992862 [Macrosteles quadrilineatus]
MSFLTGSVLFDILLGVLSVCCGLYWYICSNDDYWEKRGVPHSKYGLLKETLLGRKSMADAVKELYFKHCDKPYYGTFQINRPLLFINDEELINKVLIKDFTYFQDRGQPKNDKELLSKNLFNLTGQGWRIMRYKLTPTFTTGKLKSMLQQVSACGENMVKNIAAQSEKDTDLDCKDVVFEYTTEVICTCAFGLQFAPGSKEFNFFKTVAQKMFRTSFSMVVKFFVLILFPKLAEMLNLSVFISKSAGDYFLNIIKTTMSYRKEHNIKRNDYLQLLMALKDQEDNNQLSSHALLATDTTEDDAVITEQLKYTDHSDQLPAADVKLFTEEAVAANSVIFLVAGSESTSNTTSLALFMIARHPHVQEKLQKEVDSVLSVHGELSYQALKEMTYLDQVIQETQRFYPLIPILQRECTKSYKVPGSDLVIEKGVLISIPVIGLQQDPRVYPDPDSFKPERFEGNNFKPNPHFLPFGDGPRICIAMRFAVMEMKAAISRVVANYNMTLSPKTKLPLKLSPRSFVPTPEGGIWINFEKRHNNAMSFVTGSTLIDVTLVVLLLSYLLHRFITSNDDYWYKRGVPHIKTGLIWTNFIGKKSQADAVNNIYKQFSREKYFGYFQLRQPILMVNDLSLIRKVLVEDFRHFENRGHPQNEKELLSRNLFNLKGQEWRIMRYRLTPTFTSGKLKGLLEQILNCSENMLMKIEELSEANTDLDCKEFLFEYTSEVVSSCAFGLQFQPKSKEFAMFKFIARKMFIPTNAVILKFVLLILLPKVAKWFNFKVFVSKHDGDYFLNLVKSTLKYRKENNIKRNDYLQLLLTMQEQEEKGVSIALPASGVSEEDVVLDQMKYTDTNNLYQSLAMTTKLFTDEAVAANSIIFMVAGSESTSNTISLALLQLTQNPQVMLKLRKEVDSVLAFHGEWSNQALKEMVYMDQVIQETLRLYPLLPFLLRECTRDYQVPGSALVIQQGVLVAVPVIGLHMDVRYYPDPQQFKPERFQGNNFKPNPTYLPFGDGPRICIAMRFAVMEIKTAIAGILANYDINLSSKTQLPLKMNNRSFVPVPENGIWLTFKKREK